MVEKMEFKVVRLLDTDTMKDAGYGLLARRAGRGAYHIRVVDDGKTLRFLKPRDAHQKRRELSGSPRIAAGQIWCDCDPRMTRWIRIIETEPDYVVFSTCAADGTGFGRHLRAKYETFQLDGQDLKKGFALSYRSR